MLISLRERTALSKKTCASQIGKVLSIFLIQYSTFIHLGVRSQQMSFLLLAVLLTLGKPLNLSVDHLGNETV